MFVYKNFGGVGNGMGGRNTELALAFGMAVNDVAGITFLSPLSDGNPMKSTYHGATSPTVLLM